jgi:hypothetical protein
MVGGLEEEEEEDASVGRGSGPVAPSRTDTPMPSRTPPASPPPRALLELDDESLANAERRVLALALPMSLKRPGRSGGLRARKKLPPPPPPWLPLLVGAAVDGEATVLGERLGPMLRLHGGPTPRRRDTDGCGTPPEKVPPEKAAGARGRDAATALPPTATTPLMPTPEPRPPLSTPPNMLRIGG